MKTFLLIASAVAVCVQCSDPLHPVLDTEGPPLKEVVTECISDSGVDPQLVLDVINNHYVEDPKLLEELGCVYKRMGIFNDEGDLDRARLDSVLVSKLHIPPKPAEEAVKQCTSSGRLEWSVEESSFELDKCLRKFFRARYIEFF